MDNTIPLHEVPYSSPEARSRAELALDDGRLSVHDHPAHRRTSRKATPLDDLLFNVGQSREKLIMEIEAAHAMLPDAAVPRRKGETDERSIAQRLRMFLELVDRRSSELLDANNREVERRRTAERQRDIAIGENVTNALAALKFSTELAGCADDRTMNRLWAEVRSSRDDLATAVIKSGLTAQFDAMVPEQERLAILFCEEIAGRRGSPPSHPDPVRLLEMAHALYKAEVSVFLQSLTQKGDAA